MASPENDTVMFALILLGAITVMLAVALLQRLREIRRLADLVHPDYAELVTEYLRRHAAGEAAPARLEVELQADAAGRPHRLELSFSRTMLDRRPAVIVTGVEMTRAHGHAITSNTSAV